jgi:hypothetical protein
MITVVGAKLFNKVVPRVMLPYTRELVVRFIDIDTAMDYLKFPEVAEIRLAKSTDPTGRGYHYLLISKNKILSIPKTINQYLYILDCQYECFKIFFEKFNIPLEELNAAYEMLKFDNFYYRACTPAKHKKKNLIAGVYKRIEVDKDVYIFKVLDDEQKIIFSQELPSAMHEHIIMSAYENMDRLELMENKQYPITGYLSDGWKKDVFYFTWGNPDISTDVVYYEFHMEKMELKRIN